MRGTAAIKYCMVLSTLCVLFSTHKNHYIWKRITERGAGNSKAHSVTCYNAVALYNANVGTLTHKHTHMHTHTHTLAVTPAVVLHI